MASVPQVLRAVLLGLSLLAGAAPAQALNCGTTLYQSVTLTADIVCPPGVDALTIGDHKVRIDLNGFSIRGPYKRAMPTAPAYAIVSSGYDAVQIVGPGTIEGFAWSVQIVSGNNHFLGGVDVVGDAGGIDLRGVSSSRVEDNHLPLVLLQSYPHSRATGNRITGNTVESPDTLLRAGITLSGCHTQDNIVADNAIRPDYSEAVSLVQGANANQVLKNRITTGWISLGDASNNLIAGNSIKSSDVIAGIDLIGGWSACGTGPSGRNVVRDNRIYGFYYGVYFGSSGDNLVTRNVFSKPRFSALVFMSSNNDARGNTYLQVPVIAYDYGTGNLWP